MFGNARRSITLLVSAIALAIPSAAWAAKLEGEYEGTGNSFFEKLSFNFINDLAPVAGLVQFPNVMTVGASFPAKTVPEFIAYAKAHPGKLNQGSSGRGTTQHLAGELFKIMTGTDFVHVPYRGAAPALTDLLGGQVQVLFEALPPSIEHIKAGTLRGLAVTTAGRSPVLPDVPTVGEFVPGYEASGWNGILAPKNTPADIIARLNAVVNAGLAEPRIKTRLAGLGATMLPGSPTDFGKLIASETDKWGKVIRTAGIKPE